jgi:MinD-like ATPase involved in chromosome partitioning or flagellar assembly
MTAASIAIAASGRDWALGLHRFVADHGGARVRVRVMHPEQALDEDYDVLVIDDITSFLSAHLVNQVQRRDRKVLGVFEEPAGEQRLHALGVNAVMRADSTPDAFVHAIVDLASQPNVDQEFAELIADLHGQPGRRSGVGSGRVVAVAGSGGGVGATEVAVGLSAELARQGRRVCLVDADDVAPAVAQRLHLPLYPNIRTAMDHLQHRDGSVRQAVHAHRAGFTVLAGLPSVRDWRQVRFGEAVDVVGQLACENDVVLVNISPMVEQMMEGPRGEGRFGVARLVLSAAHRVVVVAGPTPVGIARLIEWYAETNRLIPEIPIHVLMNRFGDGRFAKGEIEQEIREMLAPASVTFAPYDPKLARATWEGTLGPAPAFRRAIEALVASLVPAASRSLGTPP